MHYSVLALQMLASIVLFVRGALTSADHKQEGCYQRNALLDCPLYQERELGAPSMVLKWRFWENATGMWKRLATIRRGKQRIFPLNTNLHGRFSVFSNGSLEIKSLHPADETLYLCIVMEGGDRESHLIELSLACGGVTAIKREVCVEEDVVLDCEAKHRTVPWKLKQITWKKNENLEHDTLYSKVATLKDSTVEAFDGFSIHSNGSLVVHKGRSESNQTYECGVTNIDDSQVKPHYVELRSIKCQKELQKPGTVKITSGNQGSGVAWIGTRARAFLTSNASAHVTQNTTVCGGVLSDPFGGFQSPNFPGAYSSNSHCQWNISVPQAYSAINITLHYLNLESEKKCRYDNMAVYDQLSNQVGCRHCGFYIRPVQIQVRGRQAVVIFKSDGSVEKTGFKASYKGV